jgi:TPR repeat protein
VPLYKLAAAGGYPAAMASLGNMCIGTAAGASPRTIRRLCAGIAKLRTQVTQKQCFSWGPSTNTGGAFGEYAHGSLAAHPDEAMRWYRKSANLGYQLAKTRIEYLEKAAEAIARVTHDVRTDRVALGFRRRPQPSRQRPRASR